jgi:hypothetical protein
MMHFTDKTLQKECAMLLATHFARNPAMTKYHTSKDDRLLFRKKIGDWLKKILFLCHCLSGLPLRGEEELTLKYKNCDDGIRDLFWHEDHIMFVSSYSKQQSFNDHTRTSCRHAPPLLSFLLKFYIFIVVPFLEAYSVEDDVGLTFKVFPFSGLQFYSIFKGMSRDYFNCEIGLRDWRQVAVIFRKTLPDDLVSASLVVSANQANHSAEMQALHYDHHNFETRSCSSDTMLSTLVFSKSWWKYMGVCVDKDLISIAGFKSPSFQSMVMMDDTSLLRSMRLAVSDQDATWKNEFQC